jgi:hypothetical protein
MRLLAVFSVVLTLFLIGCKGNDVHTTPPSHPQYFDMTIDLNSENNKYIVETKVTLLMETSRNITLHFTLQELNTSNEAISSNQVSNLQTYEKELYNGTWKVGEEKHFEIPLYALPKGEYDIRVQALAEKNENGRWGGLATIRVKTNEDEEVIKKVINIVTDH